MRGQFTVRIHATAAGGAAHARQRLVLFKRRQPPAPRGGTQAQKRRGRKRRGCKRRGRERLLPALEAQPKRLGQIVHDRLRRGSALPAASYAPQRFVDGPGDVDGRPLSYSCDFLDQRFVGGQAADRFGAHGPALVAFQREVFPDVIDDDFGEFQAADDDR